MNYEEFLDRVSDDLSKAFPGAEIGTRKVEKLQGESYQGIEIHEKDSETAPVFNLQGAYDALQSGDTYDSIVEQLIELARSGMEQGSRLQTGMLQSYESVKEILSVSLVPVKGNEEMLKSIPYTKMEDLAVVYRAELEPGTSTVISNAVMERFGITKEQLHEDAVANGQEKDPGIIRPLHEVLGLPDELVPENVPELMVVTSTSGIRGAGVIAYPGMLEDAAEIMGGDFFMLPSSIHEVLLMQAKSPEEYRNLEMIVREINATEVAPQDRLSDRIYHYDSREHVFELAERYAQRSRSRAAEERPSMLEKLKEKKAEAAHQPGRPPAVKSREAIAL